MTTFRPAAVVEVDVAAPLDDVTGLDGYERAAVLVRADGTPLAQITVPVVGGRIAADLLCTRINETDGLPWRIGRQVLLDQLAVGPDELATTPEDLVPRQRLRQVAHQLPAVTVAVCTRDRTEDLARCLPAIAALDLDVEVLVIDNAPGTDRTRELVRERFPWVRYVHEPRPGLDFARNRAVLEASGEVVAFCDDDAVPDPAWARRIAEAFAEDPGTMCVTGLVVAAELETEAQELFERSGGFNRGFDRRFIRATVAADRIVATDHAGSAQYGTGANMAFRRSVFAAVGMFDPALDVGTVTGGAGDAEMFFRVLKGGFTLRYEPAALVRHRHRRAYEQLRRQMAANGSVMCALAAIERKFPDEAGVSRTVLAWAAKRHGKRFVAARMVPDREPPDLVLAEIAGFARAVRERRYERALADAAEVVEAFGPHPELQLAAPVPPKMPQRDAEAVAVRTVELGERLAGLTGLARHRVVRCFVTSDGTPIGQFDLRCEYRDLGPTEVAGALVDALGLRLVDRNRRLGRRPLEAAAWGVLARAARPRTPATSIGARPRLDPSIPASVVLATCDRPDDLRRCLLAITQQKTERTYEIIVADNRPDSGLTAPVVAEFPGVRLVSEPRAGAAYARNAGLLAATHPLIAITDDDTVPAPDWLEELLAPFERPDVMAVTGNVLPLELETPSQQHFERFAALGRGFHAFEVGRDWFGNPRRAVATWELGCTANVAVRASVLRDPEVGFLDEALGPGTPTGVGEDSYLLYRVLRSRSTIVYEPAAVVWHHHRRTDEALRKQIYGYYKGTVAHQLATFHHDGDLRAVVHSLYSLPRWWVKASLYEARHPESRTVPMRVWGWAGAGIAAGPFGYLRSQRRATRLGRTEGTPSGFRGWSRRPRRTDEV